MNLRNKVSFFLLSFVAVPLFAQTPQQELERLQQNYIQSFISNDDRMASLVELLSGIQPETEISDQVVVELHQRYPFNVEKIAGYMERSEKTVPGRILTITTRNDRAGLSRNMPTGCWN